MKSLKSYFYRAASWFGMDLDEALERAALEDDAEKVEALVGAGADVHAGDDRALCLAAAAGRTEAVERLLEAGANIHGWDGYAYKRADWNCQVETTWLLKKWLSREAIGKRADSRWEEKAYAGDRVISLQSHFYRAAAYVGLIDLDQALVNAAARGQRGRIRALLMAGADVHGKNGEAAYRAARTGHTRTSGLLVAAGAHGGAIVSGLNSLYGYEEGGFEAADAPEREMDEAVENELKLILLASRRELQEAADRGYGYGAAWVESGLESRAAAGPQAPGTGRAGAQSARLQARSLRSYFYGAAAWLGLVNEDAGLSDGGADDHGRNERGIAALVWRLPGVARWGEIDEAMALIRGCDPNDERVAGALNEALRVAAQGGHTEMVRLLLEAGADVHADDDVALCAAAWAGQTETVKALLEAGADVYARGGEALSWTMEHGYSAAERVLREWMVYGRRAGGRFGSGPEIGPPGPG